MVDSLFQDQNGEARLFTSRAVIAGVLVAVALLLVALRLVHLQVERHEHFSTLSQDNRVKLEPLPPTRGMIYDANGIVLAENHPSFALTVTTEKAGDLQGLIDELARVVPIDAADLQRFERSRRRVRPYQGVALRTNLTEEEVARIAVNSHRFPSVDIGAELLREYPLGVYTAHVLGYVGRINEEELKRIDVSNYRGTSYIGKGGVEKAYEDELHGRVGHQQVEVNAKGRVLRVLESEPPAPGKDLRLYLDIRLQQDAAAALEGLRGAAVAIDPATGGVLAMVSSPSFDPNPFVLGIGIEEYAALRDSLDVPLFDRALRGQYPPGSTVKPFVGLGGLATGVVGPTEAKYCPGFYQLPNNKHKYRDWKRWGHGRTALEKAIVESCDVYFYDLAHDMGIERLHGFLAGFGFGERTGVDVAGELGGLLPSREWKRRARKQAWYPGETLIVGIGQGAFLATPLQLAAATATLANRGRFIEPRVARATHIPGLGAPEPVSARVRDLGLNQGHVERVIHAMTQVVEGARGTARRIRTDAYRIAGKTGTAQVFTVGQRERYNESEVAERMRDHALFVAFAPVDEPRIAVAVIVENGGHGGSVAAPIARALMDSYLLRDRRLADKGVAGGE
jgi:penicillin-binding protein 2